MELDRNELDNYITGHYGEDQELGDDETMTPAPWSVIDGGGTYTIQNLDIDEIVVWEMGGIDNEANARLIAAAPELLDMVQTLADGLEWNIENTVLMNESDSEALSAARALIAIVKGEPTGNAA